MKRIYIYLWSFLVKVAHELRVLVVKTEHEFQLIAYRCLLSLLLVYALQVVDFFLWKVWVLRDEELQLIIRLELYMWILVRFLFKFLDE